MKKSNIVLITIGVVLVFIIGALITTYNGMVSKSEAVDTQISNLDVVLQRRADLIPNLVNTVKGYAAHETEAINKVVEARQKMVNAKGTEEKLQANEEVTKTLDALMVVVENYPDLKASQNFMQLSDELAGTENRISTARRDYNTAVKEYNLKIKKFPGNIIAGMFGFGERTYFEAEAKSMEVPSVNF